jgi:hypothetical protein
VGWFGVSGSFGVSCWFGVGSSVGFSSRSFGVGSCFGVDSGFGVSNSSFDVGSGFGVGSSFNFSGSSFRFSGGSYFSQYFYLFVASPAGRSGVAARFLKLVFKPSKEGTGVVDAGQRACEMSKQALKIVQQNTDSKRRQFPIFYLFVASSAGRFGVAARFSKLVCKPLREEMEVVDAGQRACETSKQALKIVQQIANDGSSQYFTFS